MKRLLAWGLLLAACNPAIQDGQGALSAGAQRAHGPVVARVGKREIGLEDVTTLARETGFPPEQALERLVAEDILQERAESQGYGDSSLTRRELKNARARALLEVEVERAVLPESISAEAIKERFERIKPTLSSVEKRELVRLVWLRQGQDPKAMHAAAEQALARLRLTDPASYRGELGAIQSESVQAGLKVKMSGIHSLANQNDELSVAARTLVGPGLVPRVVETRTGFNVVVLESIIPSVVAELADHEASIRAQLVNEGRHARTEALVGSLRKHTDVTYHEDVIARALGGGNVGGPQLLGQPPASGDSLGSPR